MTYYPPDGRIMRQWQIDAKCESTWFKNTLQTAMRRDPIDALNDAEKLVSALQRNLDATHKAANALREHRAAWR